MFTMDHFLSAKDWTSITISHSFKYTLDDQYKLRGWKKSRK